ncbi:uncharacterized protein PAC_12903 [Phialocephala subalpina]|uniref:2EXR domain-containing protein n=1 Tax=Phialocephala subalpina TaxID=576137 RepID=A0A1L7XDE0_9HELO|nr:uncharacterized protein PAC_12903 [Phialocephala subalpina]
MDSHVATTAPEDPAFPSTAMSPVMSTANDEDGTQDLDFAIPAKSFPKFQDLPIEIRLMIWKLALPPRIVNMEPYQPKRMVSRVSNNCSIENGFWEDFFDAPDVAKQLLDNPSIHSLNQGPWNLWTVQASCPSIIGVLNASHEARDLANSQGYSRTFGMHGTRPSIVFSARVDTFYISWTELGQFLESSYWEHAWDLDRVENLALGDLPYGFSDGSFIDAEIIDEILDMAQFKNLKRITLVIEYDVEDDRSDLVFMSLADVQSAKDSAIADRASQEDEDDNGSNDNEDQDKEREKVDQGENSEEDDNTTAIETLPMMDPDDHGTESDISDDDESDNESDDGSEDDGDSEPWERSVDYSNIGSYDFEKANLAQWLMRGVDVPRKYPHLRHLKFDRMIVTTRAHKAEFRSAEEWFGAKQKRLRLIIGNSTMKRVIAHPETTVQDLITVHQSMQFLRPSEAPAKGCFQDKDLDPSTRVLEIDGIRDGDWLYIYGMYNGQWESSSG